MNRVAHLIKKIQKIYYSHPKIKISKIYLYFYHEIEVSKVVSYFYNEIKIPKKFLYSPKTEILAYFIKIFNFANFTAA